MVHDAPGHAGSRHEPGADLIFASEHADLIDAARLTRRA
jgi:hypothetical protein